MDNKRIPLLDRITRFMQSVPFCGIVAYLSVLVIFIDPSIKDIKRYPTYGVKYAVIFVGLFLLLRKIKDIRISMCRTKTFVVLCILFGFFNTAGLYLYYEKSLPSSIFGWVRFFMSVIVYSILFHRATEGLAYAYKTYSGKADSYFEGKVSLFESKLASHKILNNLLGFYRDHRWLAISLLILICWLPWILMYYPASIEWDTYMPIREYLGLEVKTDHHPWLYATIVGTFYKLGIQIGNKNLGMFLYIMIRDVICAFIYGGVVCKVREYCHSKLLYFLSVLFYAVTPMWGAYAKCAFKNTISTALFSLIIVKLIDIIAKVKNDGPCISDCIQYAMATLFFCLFLKNGVYVMLPVSIILVLAIIKKHAKEAVIVLLAFAMFFAYQRTITINGVAPTSPSEALAIPMQQLSRTVRDHGYEFSDQEREWVEQYADIQFISDMYYSVLSDPVKEIWVKEDVSLADFFKIWAHFLVRYPKSYMEAFFAHTYGYYAFTPREPDVAYGYSQAEIEHAANFNFGMTYFGWVKDIRFPEDFTCDYIGAFETPRRLLHAWAVLWDALPVLNITDMIPFYTWMVLLVGLYMSGNRSGFKVLPVIAGIIMILTCIASPVNGCFRYYSPVAAAFPALLICVVVKLHGNVSHYDNTCDAKGLE